MEVPHCEMRHLQHFFSPLLYQASFPNRTPGVRFLKREVHRKNQVDKTRFRRFSQDFL